MASARLPLVGLTTYTEHVTWGTRSADVALVQRPYYELVAAAGGRPVLLPPTERAAHGPATGAARAIEALDALVVIGGLDVDPARYGATPHPKLGRIDQARDESETALLLAALDADLPLLAICRGHQLLNVALGGTLHQHVPDLVGHEGHQPGDGLFGTRLISTELGTLTAAVFGPDPEVLCSHHQVIDRLGAGLSVTAVSVEAAGAEPLIEAIELAGARFCLSVQWHPEEGGDQRPFDALVAAC
jgi:gamma-glutamyl-gamma-aminobutyrate hydrolase PuuD